MDGFARVERDLLGKPSAHSVSESLMAVVVVFDCWRVVDKIVVRGRDEEETGPAGRVDRWCPVMER